MWWSQLTDDAITSDKDNDAVFRENGGYFVYFPEL